MAQRIGALAALACLLLAGPARAADEGQTLAGVARVRLSADAFKDDERAAGFEVTPILEALEAKLRRAGMQVGAFDDPSERRTPLLFVSVNTMATPQHLKAPFHISLELTQVVTIDRSRRRFPAITWKQARFGNGDAAYVRDAIQELLNEFLVDWLQFNPQPQLEEKPKPEPESGSGNGLVYPDPPSKRLRR